MKSLLLTVAVMLLSIQSYSQEKSECNADVSALQAQIKLLAEQLGDNELIAQIEASEEEASVEQKLAEFETKKITLSEKDPNPYELEQDLTFTIPEEAKEVVLIFSNSLGQDIRRVHITERGETTLKIYMANYMAGNYSYSILVDGEPLDS